MSLEIERKFLCSLTKEEAIHLSFSSKYIHSTYLENTKESIFRIVKEVNQYGIISCKTTYKKTIKDSLVREEKEEEIPKIIYDSIDHKSYSKISKQRFLINHNNNIWEIDFFEGYDFVIAELEFKTEQEALDFNDFPSWIIEEVTNDPTYLNCNLARK